MLKEKNLIIPTMEITNLLSTSNVLMLSLQSSAPSSIMRARYPETNFLQTQVLALSLFSLMTLET